MCSQLLVAHDFRSKQELAHKLAMQIARDLEKALAEKGRARLAVSGGSTPKMMFQELSKCDLDWANVTIVPVDERWVDEHSDRSNGRLIKQNLIQNKANNAQFVPLYGGGADPQAGLDAVTVRVTPLMPLDVVILGMGTDGHTASFFPNGDMLASAIDMDNHNLLSPMQAPGADEPRVTFTLKPLMKAHKLYLHVEGAQKRDVLKQAQSAGAVEDMPIRAVLRNLDKPLNIYSCA